MSTSEKLLQILEDRRGQYVSGAEISSRLGVSRTSIWKAARKLRAEGYRIEAVTNRGYRLAANTANAANRDSISAAGIERYLDDAARRIVRPEVFASVDSTNTVCADKASSGEPGGYTAISGMQTAGRGRRGRSFYSPADTGLYISLLLRPEGYSADKALRFTTSAAVSVCEAIERVCGYDPASAGQELYPGPQIKWVNDIYMRGRKVCGILTEASFNIEDGTLDYAVIGIGINVYMPVGRFPEDIREIAGAVIGTAPEDDRNGAVIGTALEDDRNGAVLGISVHGIRNLLAAEVLNRLVRHCILSDKSCIDEYRKRCMVPGREIDVISHSGRRHAAALDLDDECRLLVRYEDGSEEYLSSGEISIRI